MHALVSKLAPLTVACLAGLAQPGDAAADSTLTTIANGLYAGSDLIFDQSGALYGTTGDGGTANYGTVFKLTPPVTAGGVWGKTVLYNFTGGAGGGYPFTGLIFDQSGALYGTTAQGGAGCALEKKGCGTVFKLSPPPKRCKIGGGPDDPCRFWTETVLHSFTGADGSLPVAGVIFDQSGALYGTTAQGGAGCALEKKGCGTVFNLTPPATAGAAWTETLLHSFTGGADGAYPRGGLIFDKTGALYGTTFDGGTSRLCVGGCGTVFKLTPPKRCIIGGGRDALSSCSWTEAVLHSFTGVGDGAYPDHGSLIFDKTGALYGTTLMGGTGCSVVDDIVCGTVFKLSPPATAGGAWTETLLHSFTGGADGSAPGGGLIFDQSGALYGTTSGGGAWDFGTVFKLARPNASGVWTETVLHSFTGGADGASPGAGGGLIFDQSGTLYGTTAGGGTGCAPTTGVGCGTVFKLIP
jgi:uncharacterized repeat protein (TIGR03803 family)